MKDENTKMINISCSVLNSAYTGASSQPVWYAGSEHQGYAPVVCVYEQSRVLQGRLSFPCDGNQTTLPCPCNEKHLNKQNVE